MDYEKKYKEALERARKFYNELAACRTKRKVAAIFPELAESEDERIRQEIISALKFANDGGVYNKHIAYLEKQKPAEWSKEDRRTIDRACVALRAYANGELPDILPSEILEYADKLQSLRPQPRWKPSEEQMEALMLAIEGKCPPTSYMSRRLEDLYEGLVNTYDIQENYLNNAGYSNHEQPSEDLEEEIKRYLQVEHNRDTTVRDVARHFANWQKSQMPMPEDTVLFNKGVAEGRRLERQDMLKDAVEGLIFKPVDYDSKELIARYDGEVKIGDKVKIVIVPEKEE